MGAGVLLVLGGRLSLVREYSVERAAYLCTPSGECPADAIEPLVLMVGSEIAVRRDALPAECEFVSPTGAVIDSPLLQCRLHVPRDVDDVPAPWFTLCVAFTAGRRQRVNEWGHTTEGSALLNHAPCVFSVPLGAVQLPGPAAAPCFCSRTRGGGGLG